MNKQKPRILIVEDDEAIAANFKRALESIGDSRIAERSDQVYREIIDFDPQLILLDIVLEGEKVLRPKEAGIGILEVIKNLRAPFSEIPVVVVTALIDLEIENRCRKLGAVDFHTKPVSIKTLRLAVQKALDEQLSRRQQQINVFISSPMKELEAERQIVKQAIRDLGAQYNPELAEDWVARPEPPAQIWQRAARECDVFVLLLGQEYGTPSLVTGISPTEDEYNQALAADKPVLVFLKGTPRQKRAPRLVAFLARLQDPDTGHLVRYFTTFAQLRAEIQRAIPEIRAPKQIPDWGTVPARRQATSPNDDEAGIAALTILFLAADPIDNAHLRLGKELHEIQENLQQRARLRDRFVLHHRMAVRPEDISQAMLDLAPQIVHFSGHGTVSGELCFENQSGETHPIQPQSLATLFAQFKDQVNCVILNACYSDKHARAINQHIDYVVGISEEISDKAAIAFTVGFYQALGAGREIEEAYELGCAQFAFQYGAGWENSKPVLLKREQTRARHQE